MSQQINLFNPVFLRQKHYFSALAMLQALALIVLGVLAIYGYEARQNRVLERAAADTERHLTERRTQLVAFSKQFSDQSASKALAAELDGMEARLLERKSLLGDVRSGVGGDVQGYSRYLGALARAHVAGIWLTGLEIGGKSGDLVIKGRALDGALVPAYIRALNREEPFGGRRIGELRLVAKSDAAAKADTNPADASKAEAPRGPSRYIEFTLSIPLRGES
jgi:hypothetical protein